MDITQYHIISHPSPETHLKNHEFDAGCTAFQCVPIVFSCVGTILFQPWVTARTLFCKAAELDWAGTAKLLCFWCQHKWKRLRRTQLTRSYYNYFLVLLLNKMSQMWLIQEPIVVSAATSSRDIAVTLLNGSSFHGRMFDASKKSTNVYKDKPWQLCLNLCLSSLEVTNTHAVVT